MVADPRPATDAGPPPPSLFDRALGAARSRAPSGEAAGEVAPVAPPAEPPPPRPPVDRRALLTALPILAAPLLTLAGATWLAAAARTETAAIERRAAPLVAARADRDRARASLSAAWTRPTLGATVEAVARALPAEAALLRVERTASGGLTIEVAAPDPDRLAAVLRRDPALGGLRTVAQVPGDGVMRVTLEQAR